MFTVPELAAEALCSFLAADMSRRFGSIRAGLIERNSTAAQLALECIGDSDALYHNVEHTMLVTLAGYDIMKGRSLLRPHACGRLRARNRRVPVPRHRLCPRNS